MLSDKKSFIKKFYLKLIFCSSFKRKKKWNILIRILDVYLLIMCNLRYTLMELSIMHRLKDILFKEIASLIQDHWTIEIFDFVHRFFRQGITCDTSDHSWSRVDWLTIKYIVPMSPLRLNDYSVAYSVCCQNVWLGCSWKYHDSDEVKGAECNEFHWFLEFGNVNSASSMIFTGRSVDALDEVRGNNVQTENRRDVSAVAIAAGWFSSLRRPGKRNKKGYQKQAKSAWDLSTLSMVS